jgi:hypothetical protein
MEFFFVFTLSKSGDFSAGMPFKDEDITSGAVRVTRAFSGILGPGLAFSVGSSVRERRNPPRDPDYAHVECTYCPVHNALTSRPVTVCI